MLRGRTTDRYADVWRRKKERICKKKREKYEEKRVKMDINDGEWSKVRAK